MKKVLVKLTIMFLILSLLINLMPIYVAKATAESGNFEKSEAPYNIKVIKIVDYQSVSEYKASNRYSTDNTDWLCGDAVSNGLSLLLDDEGRVWKTSDTGITQLFKDSNLTFIDIAAGYNFAILLDSNGYLHTFGKNTYYQLGNGNVTDSETALLTIGGTKTFKHVYASRYSGYALDDNGKLYAWGDNLFNQIGVSDRTVSETIGTYNNVTTYQSHPCQSIPTTVFSDFTFTGIETNNKTAVGYLTNGKAVTWGTDYFRIQNSENMEMIAFHCNTGISYLSGDTYYTKTFKQPTLISDVLNIKKVSIGKFVAIVLTTDNKVYTIGENRYGSTGTNKSNDVLEQPIGLETVNIIDILAGNDFSAFLDSNHKVWTCGRNDRYQLGNGNTTNSSNLIAVNNGDATYTKFAKTYGEESTHVIDSDGNVWGWGRSSNLSGLNSQTPVQMAGKVDLPKFTVTFKDGDEVVKTEQVEQGKNATAPDIKKTGYILSWDKSFSNVTQNITVNAIWKKGFSPEDCPYNLEFEKVSAGDSHSMAIDIQGQLWVWGDNTDGQLGNGTNTSSNVPLQIMDGYYFTYIAAGNNFSMAIDEEGQLWSWGLNDCGQLGIGTTTNTNTPTRVKQGTRFKVVSTGDKHTLAIDSQGKTWAWGKNTDGQLGTKDNANKLVPTRVYETSDFDSSSQATFISAGYNASLGKGYDFCSWGNIEYGKIGKYGSSGQKNYPYETYNYWNASVQGLAVGYNHSLALLNGNKLYVTGDNTYGQLGDGTTTQANDFKQVMTDKTFTKISTRYNHSMAIDSTGKLWVFGQNLHGQLGNGTVRRSITPIQVKEGTTFKEISAGKYHSLAIDTDGNLWAMGMNENGELGNGKNEDSTVPVQITGSGFTVTFKDGNNVLKTQNVSSGKSATAPEVTKTGYSLSWDKDFSNITEDLEVNAVWTANTYFIALYPNGGTINSGNVTSYTYGTAVNLPTDITKEGFGFVGWFTNDQFTGNPVTSVSGTDIGDKSFYAKWENNVFEVVFKNGEEEVSRQTVLKGQSATAPEITQTGYVLSWDKDFSNVTEDLEVNAIWTASNETQYKVQYYVQDKDTEVEGYQLHEEETLQGTTNTTATAEIKLFTGFTYDNLNTENVLSSNINADGSTILKVYYKRNIYQIEYVLNGGEASGLATTYMFDKKLVLSRDITKEGSTFVAWFDNPELSGTPVTEIPEGTTGDLIFYAKWSEGSGIQKGDLNGDGGISLLDLSLLNQAIVGKITLTDYQKQAADINNDGQVTLLDLSLLNQVIVGKYLL